MSGSAELRARVEELRARGFRPTKTRGQNFLCDANMLAAIVADAGVGPGDRVLEVGVGLGFLTHALVDAGCDVTAIEIDPELAAFADETLGGRARLVIGDALATKNRLGHELTEALVDEGDWHLVANLPYSISGPLLVLLARTPNRPKSMTVLVQRELAQRVAAPPGSKLRGALGARLELGYHTRLGRTVGAQLFWPRPRVASALAHLERRPAPDAARLEAYDRLVGALFQTRRKALRASLGSYLGAPARADEVLGALGLDPRLRVEELDSASLLGLVDAIGTAQ